MMDFNIKKILVPVDFSPAANNALDSAIALAKSFEATILLIHVVETGGLSGGAQSNRQTALDGEMILTHHAEEELQSLKHSVMEKSRLNCEAILGTGMVSTVIIKTAATRQVDLIIMGTHGAAGFKNCLMGLNTFNVIKNAQCPVLSIPPQRKWDSFKKILFPVRPIPSALEKYDFVRKIIRKYNSILKVLGLTDDEDKDVYLVKELSLKLHQQLKLDQVESSTYFKVGENMADEVIKIAALIDTDLIVITANKDPSIQQHVVSAYTQHIINHAHYPVLSIKPFDEHDVEKRQHYQSGYLKPQLSFYN